MYQDVRDSNNKLLFRYDPQQQLVEIKPRGVDAKIVVDLTRYQPRETEPDS